MKSSEDKSDIEKYNGPRNMRKFFLRTNHFGPWLCLAILIAVLFFAYIGFSLHEERSFVKFKQQQHNHQNLITASQKLSLHVSEVKEVDIINLTMIQTNEDLELYNVGYKFHSFNELVSGRIGFQARTLPDTRPQRCLDIVYEVQAQVSVIICFYNEALSTLLRTINSVFKRTSPKLLKEIIVVDDGSREELTRSLETLEWYVKSKYLKMKLHTLRSNTQLGLIRARMFGARHASGDTLVFLDSHCEVNEGWIEPLLLQLVNHTSRVVSPMVDTIHPDTFQYDASSVVRGGFNWGLHFAWEGLPSSIKDPNEPYPTPTISGGLFAVNRDEFFRLGGYDEEMDEWGGENLELSFRTWMCGGSVYMEPCSRVGHVFRRRRPYGAGSLASVKNAARLAYVWLDDFKIHFFDVTPQAKTIQHGDVTDRFDLKSRLKCKSFKWYLDTIYPEIGIPNQRRSSIVYNMEKPLKTILARGTIKVAGLDICLTYAETGTKAILQAGSCKTNHNNTVWFFNDQGEIIPSGTKYCLEASGSSIRLSKCESSRGLQSWTFLNSEIGGKKSTSGKLFNLAAGQCMSVNQISDMAEVVLAICNKPTVQSFTIDALPR